MTPRLILLEYINRRKYFCIFIVLILFFIYFKFLLIGNLGTVYEEGVFSYRSWRIIEGDTLYSQIGDIRMPGHYFYFFIPIILAGKLVDMSPIDMIIFIRIILAVFEIFTFYIIYRILDILEVKKYISIILLMTIIISPFTLGWSVYANTENIGLLPFFLSIYIFLKLSKLERFDTRMTIFLGFLVGVTILIRHLSIIYYIPMLSYIILRFRKDMRSLLIFGTGIFISFLPILIYLVINNTLFDMFNSILNGPKQNVEWNIPKPFDIIYDKYIKNVLLLNPGISFIMSFGILSCFYMIKNGLQKNKKVVELTYLFMMIYLITLLIFGSYNTKYIIPVTYFSIIAFGCYFGYINNMKIKNIVIAILLISVILQGINVLKGDYIKDPIYIDNFISPSLEEQIQLSNVIKSYNVTDKNWFVSYAMTIPFLLQIDSYNHINIEPHDTYPSRYKLIDILEKNRVYMILLDPGTRNLISLKTNDSKTNISIQMRLRITGSETGKDDGFDIYAQDGNNVTVVRIHTNDKYAPEKIDTYLKGNILRRYTHMTVKELEWTNLDLNLSNIFKIQHGYIPKKFNLSIMLNADNNSSLTADIDYIKIFDTDADMRIFEEDFDNYKSKISLREDSQIFQENSTTYLRIKAMNKRTQLKIGSIGNGVLSYMHLNYFLTEKVPMHMHQNTNKIVYSEIWLRKDI